MTSLKYSVLKSRQIRDSSRRLLLGILECFEEGFAGFGEALLEAAGAIAVRARPASIRAYFLDVFATTLLRIVCLVFLITDLRILSAYLGVFCICFINFI